MHDLAVEQIGDGGKPDMRMRAHVESVAGAEFRRTEMIEEDERPDHARARRGQRAAHGEVAEVDGARHDHLTDGIALIGIARLGVLAGKETHGLSFTFIRISCALVPKQLQRISTCDAACLLGGICASQPRYSLKIVS